MIGRYEILRPIGAGGMGVLWLARDPMIDRQVAIKLMREGVESETSRKRFLREARSAGRLHHPNIVAIFDVGEHEGQPFIAMQYIEGATLADIVSKQPTLPLTRKLRWIEELCTGLQYAHDAGIVHRDIKPANVMVGDDGVVRVLDFGIARLGPPGLTQGNLIGTLNYMAPEQLEGLPIDARADIFALGALFYEVLSYQLAFSGGIEEGVLAKILYREPEPLDWIVPDIDPELVAIVSRCLAKQPDARYEDCAALARDVAAVRQRLAPGPEHHARVTSTPDTGAPSHEEQEIITAAKPPALEPAPIETLLAFEPFSPRSVAALDGDLPMGATTVFVDERDAAPRSTRIAARRFRATAVAVAMLALAGAAWVLSRGWLSGPQSNPPAASTSAPTILESPQPSSPASSAPPPASAPTPTETRPPVSTVERKPDSVSFGGSGRGQQAVAAPSAGTGASAPDATPSPAPTVAVPADSGIPSGLSLGRSEPPSPPPAPAPVPPANVASANVPNDAERAAATRIADEAAVRGVLGEYKAAYERLDAAAVKRIWPTLTAAQERQLADQFRAFKSYSLQFQNVAVSLAGTTATVSCRIARTATPKAGRPQSNANNASLELRKEGAGWVITRLSDAPSR